MGQRGFIYQNILLPEILQSETSETYRKRQMKDHYNLLRFALLIITVLSFAVGCSDSTSEVSDGDTTDTLVYELVPRLVLGENEMDEHYSLGAISAVRFLDDGRIAVLDRFAYGARIYSPAGEYQQTIGAQGEGPGEFCNPNSMAALNDRIVIVDKWALRATLFDQQGRYIDELTDSWSFSPPSFIHMVSDSFLVGGVTNMDGSDGVTRVNYMVNVMNMNFECVDTLYENTFIFESGNASQMLQMTLFSASHTTDGEGNVFVAAASPESYRIEGWNLAGENSTTITREFDPVEKTPQEIIRESERITRLIEARNPGMRHTYTPIPYRNQILPNGVHADGLNRLWVLRGLSDQTIFDVYSYSGDLLFSTIMHGIDPNEIQEVLWWSISEHGLAVFSRDPWEVPLVWVYDFPE